MKYPGKLIVLEGVDHSGKTTEGKRLKSALQKHTPRREVILTREPWGPLTGQALQAAREGLHDTAAKLMMVDRMNHLRVVVVPALKRGAIVLCDRYYPSTCIYQGATIEGAMSLYFAHKDQHWFVEADAILLLTVKESIRMARKRGEDARGGGDLDKRQNQRQQLYVEFVEWLTRRGVCTMTYDTTMDAPDAPTLLQHMLER